VLDVRHCGTARWDISCGLAAGGIEAFLPQSITFCSAATIMVPVHDVAIQRLRCAFGDWDRAGTGARGHGATHAGALMWRFLAGTCPVSSVDGRPR